MNAPRSTNLTPFEVAERERRHDALSRHSPYLEGVRYEHVNIDDPEQARQLEREVQAEITAAEREAAKPLVSAWIDGAVTQILHARAFVSVEKFPSEVERVLRELLAKAIEVRA